MPSNASDSLHRLITSLHRTEKGYVKKYCSRHVLGDGNDYLRLFDAVDAMDEYDERRLKESLCDSPMVKRLPSVKNYLFQQILEAMRAYHAAKSAERQIVELLVDADFLWEKALYDLAYKRVVKAKDLAERHFEYAFWLKIISWEKNYWYLVRGMVQEENGRDVLSSEQERIAAHLLNTIAYESVGNMLQLQLHRLSSSNDPDARKWLDAFPDLEEIKDEAHATSPLARCNFHLMQYGYESLYHDDNEKAYIHARNLIDFIHATPGLATGHPNYLMVAQLAYLTTCVATKRYDEYLAHIDELWGESGATAQTRNISVKKFYRALTVELRYAGVTGNMERLLERLPFILHQLNDLWNSIPAHYQATSTFTIAQLCRPVGKTREADAAMRLFSRVPEDVRVDIHAAVRIQQMQQAVERQDWDYLINAVRTAKRFLKKSGFASRRTDIMLSYFSRVGQAPPKRRKTLVQEALNALSNYPASTDIADIVETAGTEHWLRSQSTTTQSR